MDGNLSVSFSLHQSLDHFSSFSLDCGHCGPVFSSPVQVNDGHFITLFGHMNIHLPEGAVRITEEHTHTRMPSPPLHEPSRTRAHDPGSYMLWPLKDQMLNELPEELQSGRETHESPTVAPGEHEGFGLRFKVKGEQNGDE